MSDMAVGGSTIKIVLPGIHDDADKASLRGQKTYLRLTGLRLGALAFAAVAGTVDLEFIDFDLSGLILMLAFAAAVIAEISLIWFQPERDWYAGRAVAESTKTLAWRFAVMGEPFGPALGLGEAETLLSQRVGEVLQKGKDRITVAPRKSIVTDEMIWLRSQPIAVRRASYLEHRTEDQRQWYADKALSNGRQATAWRYGLLTGEVCALVVAALAFGRDEPLDFAGIVAAAVAGGSAWLNLKQHSQLTSAYRIAAAELAIQAQGLRSLHDGNWAQGVADAEEAISREHTMWLASRGQAI